MEQTHITYLKAIRNFLNDGCRLTTKMVHELINTSQLPKYISVLRRQKLKISRVWINEDGKRVKEYQLIKD
jgi:hypothetical protein